MTHVSLSRTPLVLVALLLLPAAAPARNQTRQSTPDDELFRTVASLDSRLFDAYNTCNLERFASFFVEDVEFYHDKGGVTRGRSALVDSLKQNICGKTRRDLIPGTLEVHPMDGYGALQIGAHRFCDVDRKECGDAGGGVGRFIHLWQSKEGAWRITRVISYDHAPAVK
ncbi:MAG TPA: nuclear transport factor 2 family protein [Vicinamibacterales bacterium]|nr:nuclear transport factor 2 family protein [Vicinamibacterales bacterium]